MNPITLLPEQQAAATAIIDWFATSPNLEFRLGGYAGTGKTTVIRHLVEAFERDDQRVAVSAFTGKAVNVLQRKGLYNACTLHSLMYDVEVLPNGQFEFHLKNPSSLKFDLIIVDEASMLSTELYNHLRTFKEKLLFVGDPGQLEPVGDNPNLMRETHLTLKTIHRQAENSPIITFANDIRLGKNLGPFELEGCSARKKAGFQIPSIADFDQVICAKNATRLDINRKYRAWKQLQENVPQVGEKIIVLRNNTSYSVFNGMLLTIDEILETRPLCYLVNLSDDLGNSFKKVPIWSEPFSKDIGKEFTIPKLGPKEPQMIYADFGYAITCHKSQGSEWDKVLVWDEFMPPKIWDMKRWRYTAITRASKELVYCF